MPPRGKGNGKKKKKQKKKKGESGSSKLTFECIFPRDIVSLILSRLPVNSLLRFRCVCKPWRKLISKPHFVNAHFEHHSLRNALLVHAHKCHYSQHAFSLFNPPESSVAELDEVVPFGYTVVGSCYGIVCLFKPPWGDLVTLWNPAMRQSRSFNFPVRKFPNSFMCMGLAYDSQEGDFIILYLWCFKPPVPDPEYKFYPSVTQMYSMKNPSWKMVENELGFRVERPFCNVIVKGVPYWIAAIEDKYGLRDVLVFFDPHRKKYDKLPMPGVRPELKGHLVELKDSLGMINWDKNNISYLDFWVMDDEDGWSKKYKVGPLFGFEKILGCLRNGDIVAVNQSVELLVFNPVTRSVKIKAELNETAKHAHGQYLSFNYTESLILTPGMVPLKRKLVEINSHMETAEGCRGSIDNGHCNCNPQQTAG